MDSRRTIRILEKDGWYLDRVNGSHHIFRHPIKKGTVTVKHPQKDIPTKTQSSIWKQAGLPKELNRK